MHKGVAQIKGDAKKMIQTLLTVGAFRLKNSHFYLICQKIDNFCFMHKGVAQKLSLPRPLENSNGRKSVNS